jgi:peroxiredoxin
MRFAALAEIGFVLLAGAAVYGFVSMARSSETRRACLPLCTTRPAYAGRSRKAPDFELPDLDGRTVNLSRYKGKTVVLSFWTSTCPPCIEEMPSLAELAKVVARRGDVVVLTVTTDANEMAAKGAIEAGLGAPAPFPVLIDPESSVVGGRYGTRLFPETWLIDKNGVIRARFDGARDWSNPLMLEFIDSLSKPMSCDIEFDSRSADARGDQICDDVLSRD